jgi:hypothetical protein
MMRYLACRISIFPTVNVEIRHLDWEVPELFKYIYYNWAKISDGILY